MVNPPPPLLYLYQNKAPIAPPLWLTDTWEWVPKCYQCNGWVTFTDPWILTLGWHSIVCKPKEVNILTDLIFKLNQALFFYIDSNKFTILDFLSLNLKIKFSSIENHSFWIHFHEIWSNCFNNFLIFTSNQYMSYNLSDLQYHLSEYQKSFISELTSFSSLKQALLLIYWVKLFHYNTFFCSLI